MNSGGGKRRVVITGVGPITSIGSGPGDFWNAVLDGRSGGRRLEFQWVDGHHSYKCRVGAPVDEPDPAKFDIGPREADLLDPASRYALMAASMALHDAGLETVQVSDTREKRTQFRVEGIDPDRAGVIVGTGIGGLCTLEKSHRLWVHGVPLSGSLRFALPMLIPNALAAQVAIKFGLHGETKAVATACAAGTMAIGDAFRLIRDGELDVVIAGGVEKTLSDFDGYGLLGFDLLRTLSTRNEEPEKASRPFDADRDGFVLSEGAGIVVLESEEHARARRARMYAEIVGYGATCDAYSMMQMEPSGDQMVRVMRKALESADASVADIGYVNAHGTSTRLNDAQEAQALHRVFGKHVWDLVVNSTKAMTGHAIGASGAIEAITAAMSLARGVAHRCVNLERPDPDCDLPLPRENQNLKVRAALSNSFAFGGHNATLVLRGV